MCLYVKDGEEIRTASTDIYVYKVLFKKPSKRHVKRSVFKSPFKGFLYFKGKKYKPVNLQIVSMYGATYVAEGFHSYLDFNSALYNKSNNEAIVRMVIPKGSQYVLGKGDEIVSSHIRFLKRGEKSE